MPKKNLNLNLNFENGNGGGGSGGVGEGGEGSFGGRLQVFTSMVILGYFGVKIFYATFFDMYPQKYYNQKVTTVDDVTQSVTKEYSQWNNELYDFVTLMILSFIIYLFANVASKGMISPALSISPSFLAGYLVGLGYPASKKMLSDMEEQNSVGLKYLSGFFFMVVALFAISSNFMSGGGGGGNGSGVGDPYHINYIVYLVVIGLVLYGLYFSKPGKKIRFIKKTPIGGQDLMDSALQNASVNLNIPFVAFVVLLLFQRDPSADAFRLVVYFLFGMLLGIMVSGVSFYGIQYMIDQEAVPKGPLVSEEEEGTEVEIETAKFEETSDDLQKVMKKLDVDMDFKKKDFDSKEIFSLKNAKRLLFLILIILTILLFYFTIGKLQTYIWGEGGQPVGSSIFHIFSRV